MLFTVQADASVMLCDQYIVIRLNRDGLIIISNIAGSLHGVVTVD